MDIEPIRIYFEIAGYAAGVASVVFLAFQIKKERKLKEYKMLQELEEKFTSLLWKAAESPELDNVWKPLPKEKVKHFNSLEQRCEERSWPVWEAMTDKEQNCYRFTRAGLEILEQAHFANSRNWIVDKEIKKKWNGWMKSWKLTNHYVPFVLMETKTWFSDSFLQHFNSIK